MRKCSRHFIHIRQALDDRRLGHCRHISVAKSTRTPRSSYHWATTASVGATIAAPHHAHDVGFWSWLAMNRQTCALSQRRAGSYSLATGHKPPAVVSRPSSARTILRAPCAGGAVQMRLASGTPLWWRAVVQHSRLVSPFKVAGPKQGRLLASGTHFAQYSASSQTARSTTTQRTVYAQTACAQGRAVALPRLNLSCEKSCRTGRANTELRAARCPRASHTMEPPSATKPLAPNSI